MPIYFRFENNKQIEVTVLENKPTGNDWYEAPKNFDWQKSYCLTEGGEIVEVLLQHISRDKLNDFVNATTTSSGTTSLHVAAKGGSLEVVKSLLKHGAIYKIENKEGKIPIDLSKDQRVTNLLKLIEELFRDIKNGNVESISKLRAVKPDEFLAIINARNNQGNTLLQVAIANKHKNIATKLLKMLKEPDQLQSQFSPECELDQLEKLKSAAEVHIRFSELYLPMLRSMSQPYSSEKNTSPWKTLKEGSYYLGNAYRLVNIVHLSLEVLSENISENFLFGVLYIAALLHWEIHC